jgi:flagellar biosynthesis component FlhA
VPSVVKDVTLHVRETVARYAADAACAPHAIVVTAPLRPLLAEFLERTLPGVAVYAYAELPPEIALEPAGVLESLPSAPNRATIAS